MCGLSVWLWSRSGPGPWRLDRGSDRWSLQTWRLEVGSHREETEIKTKRQIWQTFNKYIKTQNKIFVLCNRKYTDLCCVSKCSGIRTTRRIEIWDYQDLLCLKWEFVLIRFVFLSPLVLQLKVPPSIKKLWSQWKEAGSNKKSVESPLCNEPIWLWYYGMFCKLWCLYFHWLFFLLFNLNLNQVKETKIRKKNHLLVCSWWGPFVKTCERHKSPYLIVISWLKGKANKG